MRIDRAPSFRAHVRYSSFKPTPLRGAAQLKRWTTSTVMRKAEILKVLKAERELRFYVYQLSKPDGTPFYIGKGVDRRIFAHEREARGPERSHKLNLIRQLERLGLEIDYEILEFYGCEKECHAREIAEILRLGRHDLKTGPLTNLTAGGEGTVGLSEETKARIDANLHGPNSPGDRGIANRFYLKLRSDVSSVPVRPLQNIIRSLSPLPPCRDPTPRMAAALAASSIANRVLLEVGCRIPRQMYVEDKPMIIEYGASTNLLEAGMATLAAGQPSGQELFVLTERGLAAIIEFIETDLLVDAGVVMPVVV